MKGDGCVDKPTTVLWNNYLKTASPGIEMKLTLAASGLKANTKEQGLTEYRAHRISYCIAHPSYPRVFVWVYRHEGKKMKVELRCHAVLCKTEAAAKAMAVQLHEKLAFALKEFLREKTRRQNTRLTLQRTNSSPAVSGGIPMRQKYLSIGQNYKPPVDRSLSAPKLVSITEDDEPVFPEVLEEEEEEDDDMLTMASSPGDSSMENEEMGSPGRFTTGSNSSDELDTMAERFLEIEIGNDIDELRKDSKVQLKLVQSDSDDSSSESGFSEQDQREREKENQSSSPHDTSFDSAFHVEIPAQNGLLVADDQKSPTTEALEGSIQLFPLPGTPTKDILQSQQQNTQEESDAPNVHTTIIEIGPADTVITEKIDHELSVAPRVLVNGHW